MSKKLISALLILCLVCLPLFALADGTLNVFNYGEYIDEQVIRNFEKEFGVRVNYSLNSTPEEMYTKLQTGASFDVIVTSDYMIDRLIKEERILPLDKEIVTNLDQITDNMKGLYFDPDNTYSAPYLWQNVVLCYDTTKIDPAKVEEKGWEIFLDPELDGHAFIYESPRDVFMMAFKALGYSMNTDNPDELQEAYEWLVKMKQTIHPSFVTDEMIDGMAQGEKWIAMMYSGDAAYASMENEKLAVWAPEQGTNIAIDCMFIPSNASNPEMANQFINYVLDYDNSMMITVETCYTSPNAKVLEDVTAPGGEFDGVEGYLPRMGYEKDEIYQYVKLLQNETPELLIKVQMQ